MAIKKEKGLMDTQRSDCQREVLNSNGKNKDDTKK